MNSAGAMQTGWVLIGTEWHYFNANGAWVSSETRNGLYDVMGISAVGPEELADAYRASGATYPKAALSKGGAGSIDEFCKILWAQAASEGVRAEVVFAQAMLETGWLQFGGDVDVSQFNFAGLGAVGGGAHGETFSSVKEGLLAQVQHLKAYASTDALNQPCVDTRFNYVVRGCAPYVEYLGKGANPSGLGWATRTDYGLDICILMWNYLDV